MSFRSDRVMVAPNHPKLDSVQVLRGLAALSVVVAHSIEHPLAQSPEFITMIGRLGVEVFFVVSGLIIGYITSGGVFNPKDFAIKRVFRVVPLYWICSVGVFVIALAAPSLLKTTQADVGHLVRSLFFLPAPAPGTDDWRPIFKLGWTLNYEMFFYLVFACFFWVQSGRVRAAAVTIVLSALVLLSLFVPKPTFISFYASVNWLPFIAGLWVLPFLNRLRQSLSLGVLVSLSVLALIASGWFAFSFTFSDWSGLRGHIPLTAFATVIVVTTMLTYPLYSRLLGASLVFVGNISYSLYLTHIFIVAAVWKVLGQPDSMEKFAAAILLVVGASLLASAVSFHLIELNFLKIGNWSSRRLRVSSRQVGA